MASSLVKTYDIVNCGPRHRYAVGGKVVSNSSLGVQVHNMKRDGHKDPESAIASVLNRDPIDHPGEHLAKLIRAAIYLPEGLAWADYSNIEGRVAPWLANSPEGERKLDVFRQGLDPYKVNAATLFRVPYEEVGPDQRQGGKIQELALGFLGGAGALLSMARQFKINLSEDRAMEMRDAWRAVNTWAVPFGQDLVFAAETAVRSAGKWFEVGRIAYGYDGECWLWCRLPSGRMLAYFHPKFETVITPWGEDRRSLTAVWGGGKPKIGAPWPRRPLTPGLLLENATQATAACLLRTALTQAVRDGVEIVGHVHDEIIAQGISPSDLCAYLTKAPSWAAGLPIEAVASGGVRYGK